MYPIMNELLTLLKTRRSCRSYQDKAIPKELLTQVVEAGLYAPSARNGQKAIMVVTQNKETVATVSRLNAAVMGVDKDTFYGAPAVIHVLVPRDHENGLVDGACVMENLMVTAHSVGLATCWVNRATQVFDSEEGKALLAKWGVAGDYVGVAHCIIGYPATDLPAAAPRAEGRVFFAD